MPTPKTKKTKLGEGQLSLSLQFDEEDRRAVRRLVGKDGPATDKEVEEWLVALISTRLAGVKVEQRDSDKLARRVLAMMGPRDPRQIVEAARLGGDQAVLAFDGKRKVRTERAGIQALIPWIARLFDVDPSLVDLEYAPTNSKRWRIGFAPPSNLDHGVLREDSFLELLATVERVARGRGKTAP